ncbi:MAG: four helix bundle protein, partial [Planctomycetes bacterium]|nr:four helix bundle protein [Planctomycetota bacterium]
MNRETEIATGTKGDDIAERLLDFAAEILLVVGGLPKTIQGKHVARQLTRSGTAGGAHYAEARGAESRADFAHKVLLAAKEVAESVYWLRLIERARFSRRTTLDKRRAATRRDPQGFCTDSSKARELIPCCRCYSS